MAWRMREHEVGMSSEIYQKKLQVRDFMIYALTLENSIRMQFFDRINRLGAG